MKIVRSPRFDRAYKKLPPDVQRQFKAKLRLLVASKGTQPSLHVKKIKGAETIWEARIDLRHRFTFERIEGGIRLRVVGPHDVLENP